MRRYQSKKFPYVRPTRKDALKLLAQKEPKKLEKELFIKTDQHGYNLNASEQQKYPGPQKYKPNKDHEE